MVVLNNRTTHPMSNGVSQLTELDCAGCLDPTKPSELCTTIYADTSY